MRYLRVEDLRLLPLTPGEIQENENLLKGLPRGFSGEKSKEKRDEIAYVRNHGMFSRFGFFELVYSPGNIEGNKELLNNPVDFLTNIKGDIFFSPDLLLYIPEHRLEIVAIPGVENHLRIYLPNAQRSHEGVLTAKDLYSVNKEESGIRAISKEGYLIEPGTERAFTRNLENLNLGINAFGEELLMRVKIDSPSERRRKILVLQFIRKAMLVAGKPVARINQAVAFDMKTRRLIAYDWQNPSSGIILPGNQNLPQLP